MKLITRNVNSLKVRLPRVVAFLDEHAPGIVCMQETKSEARAFPLGELTETGLRRRVPLSRTLGGRRDRRPR